jgi:hypothetical protein
MADIGLVLEKTAMNPQAEKLVAKFNAARIRRMTRGNEKNAPTHPLFHYTTEQASFSIIKSETFWFTSIYHMDDPEELSFGFGVSHSLLSAALEREDVLTKVFLKPLVDDYNFEKIKDRFGFYSASFGQKDDPEQWNDYAGGGSGVAIGLAPGFFALQKVEDLKPEDHIFLGKVTYGEAEAKVRHAGVIDSAISVVKQGYRTGVLLKAEDEELFLHHMAAEMYVEILWNAVTTKAIKWGHQNETRLIAVNDLRNPKLEIRNAPERPRVELPQPLLRKNIFEIMLGPKVDDAAKTRVRSFLDQNNLSHVPVTSASSA